jgi:hypothetical protein
VSKLVILGMFKTGWCSEGAKQFFQNLSKVDHGGFANVL